MNKALEKMLNEFEVSHLFGVVEVHYQNGIPGFVNVKKTFKLQSNERPNSNREIRGELNGNQQSEQR
jgi:hypothetical protein